MPAYYEILVKEKFTSVDKVSNTQLAQGVKLFLDGAVLAGTWVCKDCGHDMQAHGWLEPYTTYLPDEVKWKESSIENDGSVVCPGDSVLLTVSGNFIVEKAPK